MKINTIKTDKGQIEYSIVGEGTPIMFLHGGHSNCRETLSHKGFDLNQYMLITPSRPGYGNTPLDDLTSPKKAAELLVALLNFLGIDKVVLYAVSAGGLTSIEFAARYPEKVEKLILASAVTKKWLDKNGRVYNTAQKLFNPEREKIVWGMIRFFSRIFPKVIANVMYPQFTNSKPHRLQNNDIKELMRMLKNFNSKSGFLNDLEQDVENGLISEIQCPTLIIHSKNDSSVPYSHAVHAKNTIGNSELLGLDNEWGHLFWIGNDSNEPIKKSIQFIES